MARTSTSSSSSSSSSCFSLVTIAHVLVIFFSILLISTNTVDASGDQQLGWISTSRSSSSCKGSIAECELAGDEFELDSEINRRILATTQYISYGALNKNTVPCSKRGNSYYNCQASGQANPYNRGCSAITRCKN
ncbi:Rapid alkalinization factor [Thalictrum thalictroides]|uniref:Rapid alkalinization factor n=1 Tax=Thalictrum thalictroides TaxID=46969 RepID=A0A7J6WKN7_THATH|nr:Rapid alkalinization factor [Thalictrum thalictroides]